MSYQIFDDSSQFREICKPSSVAMETDDTYKVERLRSMYHCSNNLLSSFSSLSLSPSSLSISLLSLYLPPLSISLLYPYSGFSNTLWSQCCPGIVKRVEESCLPLLASTASIMTEFSCEWLDYYIMWYTCVRVVYCRMSPQTAASRLLNKIGFAETTHPTYVCLLYTCT